MMQVYVDRRLWPSGRPKQGEMLTLGNLNGGHLRRHGVAQAQKILALAFRRARSRKVQPLVSQDDILWHAVALVIHQSQHVLAERVPPDRRLYIKVHGGVICLRS